MELNRQQSGSSPALTSHIMESLFFSMAVYESTEEAVLNDIQRRFGKVQHLISYGFDEDGQQAIFVARSRSGRIIVACRGTKGLRDIVQDLKYMKSRLSFVRGAAAHWGFAERAESVPIDVFCKLLKAGEELIFTGHSLGGAVASLLSLRVLESNKGMFDDQVHCITFGCPLFASCRLAEWIDSNYKDVFTHIVSTRDVVPKILPFVSTLQKLVYADEDHLEGLLVLRKVLELLPGIPLASFISGIERKIPSLFKFLFRSLMKVALPSGMSGSYAFAGHIVMLDTVGTVERSLVLASADEMNVWYSQLSLAFGAGFDVTMIEEHMLECYQNGILRALSHVRVKRELTFSGPPLKSLREAKDVQCDCSAVEDKESLCSGDMDVGNCQSPPSSSSVTDGKQQQNLVIRLSPPESTKGDHSMDCEIQVRCDSSNSRASIYVKQSAVLGETQGLDQCHPILESGSCSTAPRWPLRNELEVSRAVLSRTRSDGDEHRYVRSLSRSMSSRLERSMSSSCNSAFWSSKSERREDGTLVKSKDVTIKCRACSHLRVHMNITACCHQVARKGFQFGWVLGTVGRVARHLRLLDNLCYLTFVRILVANLLG